MTTSTSLIIKKLLVLFLVFAGLYYAKEFLMPLSIAAMLATFFLPFCQWMEKKKVPKGLAALACLLIFLLVTFGIGAFIAWQVSELTDDIALIKQKAIETGDRIQQYISVHFGLSAKKQVQMLEDNQPSVSGVIQMMAGSLSYIFTSFVLVLAYIFLLLFYRGHLKQFLLKLSPPAQRDEMEQVIYSIARVSQQYLIGFAKMVVCLWIMYGIGFSLAGVKSPFSFAILCGLLEIIPFIGNIVGTSITVLVAAVQGASLTMVGGIIFTYGFVQLIQGWLLEPVIVGPQVKINPFATVIALVLGEILWGIPGIILAIPLLAMFKIVCDHIESLKPLGFLIGELKAAKAEPGFIKKIKSWYKKQFGG